MNGLAYAAIAVSPWLILGWYLSRIKRNTDAIARQQQPVRRVSGPTEPITNSPLYRQARGAYRRNILILVAAFAGICALAAFIGTVIH
jgi:hypothetical protein